MKIIIYIVISFFIVNSYGQKSNESKKVASSNLESFYKIISEKEEVIPSYYINKCNVVVELKKKMSIDELKEIANSLRNTRKTYDKLWILFYLTDTSLDEVGWAMANFTPDLKVEIIGATETEEKEQKINAENVDGKIIGKFYYQSIPATYTVYENNGKTFIKTLFSDESSSITELKTKELKNGTRLEDKEGNPHGEYYVLNKNGELELWDKEGLITIAKKFE